MSLRVLCVTPFGPAGKGGIDRLYAYLRALPADEAPVGIDLRYARSRGDAPGRLWMAAFPFRLAALALALARFRPQVVHINFATGGSLPRKVAILRLARFFGARTIVHFHGEFIEDQVRIRTLAGRLFRAIATGADRVIALGEVHAAAFRRIGVEPARISVLPNAIPDFAGEGVLPKARGGPLRLLFAGLVDEHKGMHLLIPALADLSRSTTEWSLVVAGNGAVERFARLARESGIGERTTFTGWIGSDAVHAHMRQADIVVLPSRSEGLPLSLIEGACAGAALVATDTGNTATVLRDGVNGLAIPRTREAITAALLLLARDRDRLGALQTGSRRLYGETLTLPAFACSLGVIYRQTAAQPRR